MTAGEVSSVLNVSSRTARRLAEAKIIPGARKIGRSWRFDPKKFWSWLGSSLQSEEVPAPSGEYQEAD